MTFDNYNIQDALIRAQNAVNKFEKEKSDIALSNSILELNHLILINYANSHLKRYDIAFRAICELAGLYRYRYEIQGKEEDLVSGVIFYKKAKRLMGELHPDRPSILNSLGNLLLECFIFKWNPRCIEKAIEYFQEAEKFYQMMSAFESINRNERPIILNDLGNGLRERYEATGSRHDLNEAINIYEKALMLSKKNAPIYPIILNNLALSLKDRFDQGNVLDDLEKAIEALYEAKRLIIDPKYLPGILSNLGECLKYRHIRNNKQSTAIAKADEMLRISSGRPRKGKEFKLPSRRRWAKLKYGCL